VGPEHPNTIRALEGLANILSGEGHYADAEKMHREILAVRQRTLGPEHTDTLLSKYNVADVLIKERRYGEAEKMLRETQEAQARTLGAENPDTLASQATLARTLMLEGRYEEAEKTARQAYQAQLRTLGPQHADTLNSLQILGTVLVFRHQYGQAKQLFSDTLDQLSKAAGTDTSMAWYSYACVATAANDRDGAIRYLGQAIDRGYKDADHIENDDDLKSLHVDPRFEALVKRARKAGETPDQGNK
jgi:tetratricopeptide (TPR) repeat protein